MHWTQWNQNSTIIAIKTIGWVNCIFLKHPLVIIPTKIRQGKWNTGTKMSFLAFSANQMKAPSLLVDNLNIYRGVTPEHSAFLGMNLDAPACNTGSAVRGEWTCTLTCTCTLKVVIHSSSSWGWRCLCSSSWPSNLDTKCIGRDTCGCSRASPAGLAIVLGIEHESVISRKALYFTYCSPKIRVLSERSIWSCT